MLHGSPNIRSVLSFLIALIAAQVVFQFASSQNAFADSLASAPEIFDVRISLPLEPEDETYHDFYINAGPEAGFKKGMYVNAVRLIPIHDPIQNKQQATLTVNVARLQVIHVERNLTVARLDSEFTDEERPVLEYESVMIGDHIDLSSLTMETPKAKQKIKKKITSRIPTIDRSAEQASVLVQVSVPATPKPPAAAPSTVSGNSAPTAAPGASSATTSGATSTSPVPPPSTSTSNAPVPGPSAKAI